MKEIPVLKETLGLRFGNSVSFDYMHFNECIHQTNHDS
jgi:hypothetical protein